MPKEKILNNSAEIQVHPGSDNVLGIRRRNQFIQSALIGILVGGAAVLFQLSLDFFETTRIAILAKVKLFPYWGWIVLPVTGGIIAGLGGYLTQRFAPEASGSGIPQVKAVLLNVRQMNWRSLLPVKFFAGLACIGA